MKIRIIGVGAVLPCIPLLGASVKILRLYLSPARHQRGKGLMIVTPLANLSRNRLTPELTGAGDYAETIQGNDERQANSASGRMSC